MGDYERGKREGRAEGWRDCRLAALERALHLCEATKLGADATETEWREACDCIAELLQLNLAALQPPEQQQRWEPRDGDPVARTTAVVGTLEDRGEHVLPKRWCIECADGAIRFVTDEQLRREWRPVEGE